jgi:hypothetical protein
VAINLLELQATVNRADQPRTMWLRRECIVGFFGGDGDGLTILTMGGPVYTRDHTATSFGVLLKGESSAEALSPPPSPVAPPKQPVTPKPQATYEKKRW